MLRLDLGGGHKPRPGFTNVDARDLPGVDYVVDFERLERGGPPLPFGDDTVEAAYSSHCLEHVWPYDGLLHEIVRVCRVGATFELRVPHWNSSMALCNDHKHTVAPDQVDHWCASAVPHWFGGRAKRLRLERTEHVASGRFAEAKRLFAWLTDEQVYTFLADTVHETAYFFTVIPNDVQAGGAATGVGRTCGGW